MELKILYDVCNEIAAIQDRLALGIIGADKSAGDPVQTLDDIFSLIGWDVFAGKEPPIALVRETCEKLRNYMTEFKVDALKGCVEGIEKYLSDK